MKEHEYSQIINQWLSYAEGDLQSARALENADAPLRNVCYFAQQSVEKLFKALLVFYGIDIIKTHDLDVLLLRLPDSVRPEFELYDLSWLSEWSVEARYPGEWPDITREEVALALKMAEDVLNKVKRILQNT
jgi:HEPN domain-containing protein